MTLSIGDRLPEAKFWLKSGGERRKVAASEMTAGRKLVIFTLPGAFTGTCSSTHLPGYIEKAEEILAQGVDEIAVVSVNDMHVMQAWAELSGAEEKITFLADPDAEFTRAIGTEFDMSAGGLGIRSNRSAMIVEDGKLTYFEVEEHPGKVEGSSAEAVLAALKQS